MYKNKIAKILRNVGIVIIGLAVIGAIIIIITTELGLGLGLGLGVACAIQGALFMGIGEIIELLQTNADRQYQMIEQLDKLGKQKLSSIEVLSDIESHLPTL